MDLLGGIGLCLRRLRALQAPGRAGAHVFAPELDVTYRPRNLRRPTLVQISGGVIAGPGQNGHLELRVGPHDPPEHIVGALATRHESGAPSSAARVGSGGQRGARGLGRPAHRDRARGLRLPAVDPYGRGL